jgi:hypothetical protein
MQFLSVRAGIGLWWTTGFEPAGTYIRTWLSPSVTILQWLRVIRAKNVLGLELLRRPNEKEDGRGRFDAAAEVLANLASSAVFFSLCLLNLLTWLIGLVIGLGSSTESAP